MNTRGITIKHIMFGNKVLFSIINILTCVMCNFIIIYEAERQTNNDICYKL